MADATRPLPSLHDPDTRPFWEATKSHELRYQVCDDCAQVVFFPRRHCTHCLGLNLSWKTSKGEGTIYSFSVVRQNRHPAFAEKVPYAVVMVDLDEGFRLLSDIVGVDDPINDVKIGQRVRVEWEDHADLSLPLFQPL
ncbi:MAG: OB-fold domain-containing protein [Dehalococcoidia bacterium]